MDKPFAITLDPGSSLANKTGTWRTEQPVYVDLMPPCNHACPAGENIQQWLYRAEEGGAGYEAAWRQIMQDNPLPAIMGRVCYRPCETACNRGQLDSAVGINSVEGFLGDEAIRQGWTVPVTAPDSGKRVLIVGAGPSGLSAAYHLRLLGHQVTLRDTAPWAGGMMRFGIPAYRLPRDVLEAEVGRILAMGVTFEGGQTVTDIEAAMADGGFDAAFLAVGAQRGKRAEIPAGDSAKILDAVTLLHAMDGAQPPLLGRRVAVYGGGNTAMDAARTARRLGATDAVVVYRRTRDRMPAHEIEVEEAVEEGVRMMWLSTIARADEGSVTIEKMKLDETGFPQPTGEFTTLDADTVVLALGQEAELSLLDGVPGISIADGVVQVGSDLHDRVSRHLRRRRHGAGRAHRDRRHRARQTGRAQHRRLACEPSGRERGRPASRRPSGRGREARGRRARGRRAAAGRLLAAQSLVLRRRPGLRPAPAGGGPPGYHLRRGHRRPGREDRAVRGAPVPVLRQLLRVRQLLRRMPGQRGDQARPWQAVRDRPGLLQGLRDLRRRVPVRGHRHGSGANLSPSAGDHQDQGPEPARSAAARLMTAGSK